MSNAEDGLISGEVVGFIHETEEIANNMGVFLMRAEFDSFQDYQLEGGATGVTIDLLELGL